MKHTLFIALLLCFPLLVLGHQPRDVESSTTVIVNPEISKAYYATLVGEEHLYSIESKEDFNLYVGVTVPLLERAETDFLVDIYAIDGDTGSKSLIQNLSAPREGWEEFYEPFAGDMYLSGPEYEQMQPAGRYEVIVSSPDNRGQYVLAVGKIESFPVSEIISTYITLPSIKATYFDKPWYSAYFNVMTGALAVVALVLALFVWIVFHLFKKYR